MALTLDPVLATAQDSQSRHPLVEIVSAQRGNDIPFDGSFLTSETFNEYAPAMIAHSSGRIVLAYVYYDGTKSGIKFVYTDTARTEFTTVTLDLYTYTASEIKSVSLCEMTGGDIGMILLVEDKGSSLYRLARRIYTATGTAVSNAEIANWSSATYTADPWVQTIGTNSYLLVYGKKSGSAYYIYKRTSSDFLTWGSETQLSISGLTSTWRLANPSIIKITTGDLWLFFDALESIGPSGELLTNVYLSISSNGGATWGAASKLTDCDTYSAIALHPTAVQKIANQIYMIFTRQATALHMDDTASGWPTGDTTVELSWDAANRKLYAVNCYNGSGRKKLQCIVRIDPDTWTCEKYWDSTTTPGFPSFITDGTHDAFFGNRIHDGHHIVIHCTDNEHRFVWHLDGSADTITGYYFDTQAGHSITQNVTHSLDYGGGENFKAISHAQVDISDNKIWLCFVLNAHAFPGVIIGYLDLTETSDYQFHPVIVERSFLTDGHVGGLASSGYGGMYVDVAGGRIVACSGYETDSDLFYGFLAVWDIATAGRIALWKGDVDNDFPRRGLRRPTVYGDTVYAALSYYQTGYGQDSFRGLAEIDLISETITLYRPTYCSEDNHYFGRPFPVDGNRIAMNHRNYGIAFFDTVTKAWQLYSNDTIPGMGVSGDYWGATQVMYDATNEIVFVGDASTYYWNGVVAFSINGFIRQSYYSLGTNPGGGWSFATAAQLVQGFRDYDAVGVPEPGSSTSMYVFWINESPDGEQSIKWDKDGSSLNLSDYHILEEETSAAESIDGKAAALSFTVSHGHLFDPSNRSSLLNLYLKKGRKLTLRWGEKIGGTDYWQNAGEFFVKETSVGFKRGEYPAMKAGSEDQRSLWGQSHVFATASYNNMPEDIITDVAEDIVGMASGEIDLPVFAGRKNVRSQWLDSTPEEIFTQVCERFGYFWRFNVDGKLSARQITNSGAVDHAYPDNTKLIKYSSDDTYSDFTNRVVVVGKEWDYTQLTFSEERVASLSGTLGWWGCSKAHKVWFSDDQSRRCINPRLEVVETAVSIPFQLAGAVSESLVECGEADDHKFCTVNVSAPNLILLLAYFIDMIIEGKMIGDLVPTSGKGMTIPYGSAIENVGIVGALLVLGSVANYQYDIYAQPLGSVRRSVQGEWNDEEHQAFISATNTKKIEDTLCESESDCDAVAAFEGMVVQMQRRRSTFEKIAHLQDEVGDTIRLPHPYSGQDMDVFITKLTRKYKKSTTPDANDGYFTDEIEGWRLRE